MPHPKTHSSKFIISYQGAFLIESAPVDEAPMKSIPRSIVLSVFIACLTLFYGCTDDDNITYPGGLTLSDKLAHQFALYDEAQEKILDRMTARKSVKVSREEWEAWLTPEEGLALTDADMEALIQRQEAVIAQSRLEALAKTSLDLDLIRGDKDLVEQYCYQLPKGGMLHIHPGGTRNAQTIKEILEEVNPVIDGPTLLLTANDGVLTMLYDDEIAFLENLPVKAYLDFSEAEKEAIQALFLLPEDPPTHDFMRFEALFSISDILDSDPDKVDWVEEKTYLDFLERAAAQNVSYVEFTSVMWPDADTFDQLEVWADEWLARTGVTVRWNSAFVRTLPYDTNTAWTQAFIDLVEVHPCDVLVGIDLLANETNTPALDTGQNIYIPVLEAVLNGRISMHRTMHAGELGLVHNVRDAMILGAERVGHGVLMDQDPLTLEYARLVRRLPVEINLYSNYRLRVITDWAEHPFLDYLRLGLPISLSTDDEGMFITDICNECMVAVQNSDITHEEMRQMSFNALETAFASEDVKQALLEDLEDDFLDFEADWASIAAPAKGGFLDDQDAPLNAAAMAYEVNAMNEAGFQAAQ